MAKPQRPGARKGKKGATVGSGGQGRQALEGRGPTPKAEDRSWHPAGKRKAAQERLAAAKSRSGGGDGGGQRQKRRPAKGGDAAEIVSGRNSVLEALRAKVPATTLYLASRIDMDDRVKESLALATKRGIAVLEIMRPELDRMTGENSVNQGIAISVPAYEYAHALDLVSRASDRGEVPLIVALDGVTDPRNLGAIIRSTAAFGGHGVIVPQRRSAGVTAAAWKTSAGAAARTPVAMAPNLTQTLKALKAEGLFVLGLDGDGDISLPQLELADQPIVIVVGSEGKGISRIVSETCDAIVSIPISAATESLNAGIAASVTLYEVARKRSAG
ncbi:MAG: 23S rRNA (guanosine(2251)-2'-O)-methyltransferase RlmB [Microcella sp.]|uniref:23S rRNA (guanosine(2251)-2'-O)-methyltransferase RlmB n=1 Tax=Microcella sp. TaxID=1913979 RepID=UPI00331503F0